MGQASTQIELGRLYLERCDVLKAIEVLHPTSMQALEAKDFKTYLEALHYLFRAYSELGQFDKIETEKAMLESIVQSEGIALQAKTYYILALCASARKDYAGALANSQASLQLAMQADDKKDVSHAILGIAISYYYLNRLEEALKEIYNLQVFMNVMQLPQVSLSAHILKGHILKKLGKHEQALDVFWQCYEILKNDKNFYSYLTVLYSIGCVLKESGRVKEARNYLVLAQRSVDATNLVRFSGLVSEALVDLGGNEAPKHDIIFSPQEKSVIEKRKGRIDFRNQFILLDLLTLFLTNPGQTYGKETLVKVIWKQTYDPATHDNKIYVTIKRLRLLIEPDVEKPKYIFRSKNGYYFNKDANILIEDNLVRGRV